ncbi:MAG TPA: CAP domain-containing protein [Solirubrobacteraceae bacterium]
MAASVCLLAISGSAQGAQAKSTSFRRCAAAHKSTARSFHGSRCPRHTARRHRRRHSHALFFKAVNGHCRAANLNPNAGNVALVRAATLCLVNRERARHGERALHWNDRLIGAAQAHTTSMAVGGYFAHSGSNGSTPLARMRRSGYIYSSHLGFEVGENIGWGSLWLGSPRAVVAAWMASPGHRANILDGRFRDTGIGVSPHLGRLAPGQDGGLYTQDFGVISG